MIEPTYSIQTLFEQLGLPHEPEEIEVFIRTHRIDDQTRIYDAPFWNSQQAAFLQEGLAADADWAEVIDELNARLRD